MPTLVLLMATDAWDKVETHRTFLRHHQPTVWRTRGRYTQKWLDQLQFPLNLYFFHRSEVRYRAHVSLISHTAGWPLVDIPPEYHNDLTPYRLFIVIDSISPINSLPIRAFVKWDNPEQRYNRGQLGLLRVQDIS